MSLMLGRRRRGRGAALALLGSWAVTALSCAAPPEPASPEPPPQQATQPSPPNLILTTAGAEGTLAAGEQLRYSLHLEADEYLHLVVDQRGVDLVTTLFDPQGREILAVDRPIDDWGLEPLWAVASTTGRHRVEIEALEARPAGRFALRIEARRPATEGDRLRSAAARRFSEGERLRFAGDLAAARPVLESALELWRRAGDLYGQAECWDRLGQLANQQRRWPEVRRAFERALDLWRRLGDPRQEAIALTFLGTAAFGEVRLDAALDLYSQALPLRRAVGDLRGEAITLQGLGQTYQGLDEIQRAIDAYDRAAGLYQRLGDTVARAGLEQNLGVLYLHLGEPQAALDAFEEAALGFRALERRRDLAAAIDKMGQAQEHLGDSAAARRRFDEALELRLATGDGRGRAVTQANLGNLLRRAGDRAAALPLLEEALATLEALGDPRPVAPVARSLAELHLEEGRVAEARRLSERAIQAAAAAADPSAGAAAQLSLARTLRRQGELDSALTAARWALETVQRVRSSAASPDLRASYRAAVEDHHDLVVSLWMEMHRMRPGEGHDRRALQAADGARALSLLEMVARARSLAPGPGEAAVEVQEQWRRVLELAERRDASPEDGDLQRELRRALAALDRTRARTLPRAEEPGAAPSPELWSAGEIADRLLDPETALLEIHLGDDGSYLWLLDSDGLESHELAPRREIEALARRAHELLRSGGRRETWSATRQALCALSEAILAPIIGDLDHRRLLVVAGGALQIIPFAALPKPDADGACTTAPPLIAAHELVRLPSATLLGVLRQRRGARSVSPRGLAVVADPVYSPQDPRLPYSRVEGQGALDLWRRHRPGEPWLAAFGVEATRERVLGGDLAGYRWIHLATHGRLDAAHPELSSLVFSTVDAGGRPRDGHLRGDEIYDLALEAELVVLSGCRTALGKQVRGEGLIGFTQGFLHAGAQGVMVSLWQVQDRATSRLMEGFYRGLIAEGRSPSAALRAAQLELWRESPAASPYAWAGFVLLGEWR